MKDNLVSLSEIKSAKQAKPQPLLGLWLSPEEDGVLLAGNREGLQALAREILLILDYEDASPGDYVCLAREEVGMSDTSLNLAIGFQDASFFEPEYPAGEEEPWPQRDIPPNSIRAVQFIDDPAGFPVNCGELNRVITVHPLTTVDLPTKEFFSGEQDRYFAFTILANGDEPFTCLLHLDDPGLNFFTHRQIAKVAKSNV